MSSDPYCKVYLTGPKREASRTAMQAALITAVGGRFENRTLRTDGLLIDLITNTDGRGETDFIGWPFYLEITAEAGHADAEPFVASIRRLLGGLRGQAIQVVPSCDFEDQLQEFSCR
ncbi:hypothetical protein KOAAANKH_03134 [Brevundimonas sp. NIBR10]|uniref:hypothetical protein n=1 Tax=Brevundimonas sp. NIBR10 TaxID=3015997 RepID=UPI0022F1BD7D|nr:hypothetical protein [Brevundimonas sp. NIBR10]WGM48238.1 hypothetical protein KOAAANKH_03134 [Brevundimonas sp. NIBR10]